MTKCINVNVSKIVESKLKLINFENFTKMQWRREMYSYKFRKLKEKCVKPTDIVFTKEVI